jgi:hypothetical protein
MSGAIPEGGSWYVVWKRIDTGERFISRVLDWNDEGLYHVERPKQEGCIIFGLDGPDLFVDDAPPSPGDGRYAEQVWSMSGPFHDQYEPEGGSP